MADVTRILNAIERGDAKAADELLPLVYEELRRLAARKMSRQSPGHTLQPTALVHEAYIRLVRSEDRGWNSQTHFFAAAAEAMRHILIDNARRRQRGRHGGNRRKVDLDDIHPTIEGPSTDILALSEAIDRLTEEDPKAAELVKLRYFAGLTLEQVASILGVSRRTADRYWAYARAWLYHEISKAGKPHCR